jgi:hypothetical protein
MIVSEDVKDPALTHWFDTCVIIDFTSSITMSKNMHSGHHSILETRRSMQRAAWAAMACDDLGAVSVSFEHEHGRKLSLEAAPDTMAGQWTHVVANIVQPYVCPRWRVRHTHEGCIVQTSDGARHADNDERDSFMIDACQRGGLVLVTSDGPALKRARAAGVEVLRPAEFAARAISFESARDRFMERLDFGIRAFIKERPASKILYGNMNVIWESYEGVWDDALRSQS